ncbi:MAG: amidohydrolase [Chloroflexi bacterium]|nr:amidohydrolase [Chloroflexota bacterium]
MPSQTRLAFLGGKIFTSDAKSTIVSGVYAEEGRIRRVGHADEIRKSLPPDTRIIDLQGKTLLPGLMDAHNHMVHVGTTMDNMQVGYPKIGSVGELASAVANAAEDTPEGEWIRGWGMDYAKYPGGQMPTRWDIDDMSRKHPVVIVHTSGHFALVNSLALEQAGITDSVQDPKGGRFVRDEKGRLTGMLLDSAQRVVIKGAVDVGNHGPDPGQDTPVEDLVQAIERVCKMYHKEGLTSIVDAQVTAREMPAYVEARNRGVLGVKVHCMYLSNHLKDVKALGVTGFMGDSRLSAGTIKCYADGSLIGCTAAFQNPYVNPPDTYGYTYWDRDELRDLLLESHTAGLHTGTHSQGDAAMEMVVSSWEEILKEHPREDHRHRIEHCGYPIKHLERMAKLGLLAISQPSYLYYNGDGFLANLGEERAKKLIPLRSELDLGIPIVLSTDSPVVSFRPLDNISAAVSRVTMEGQDCGKDERITVEEAIRGYTINAAYSVFKEGEKGSIEVGKAADFTLIGGDLLNTPGEEIRNLSVEMTVIDGEIVYGAK